MAPRKGGEPASYEVDVPTVKGESKPRRGFACSGELSSCPSPGVETIHDVTQYAAQTRPNKRAFGWRPLVKTITEVKQVKKMVDGKEELQDKEWKYAVLGPYQWITYKEFAEKVGRVATGLWELGMGRREGQEDQFLNIYAMTCFNWQLVSHACGSISIPFCTAYDTLGPSGLTHAINQPSVATIFANADLLATVLKVLPDCPSLKTVIYDGEPSSQVLVDLRARDGVRVLSLDEVEELGRQQGQVRVVPPKREDLACVMYTSGSMGTPKGVMLSHGNLTSSISAVVDLLLEILVEEDTYLAFLPLAHILEIIVELSWVFVGMPIGYGKVKTLTDAGVRDCKGDIAELRPSIMCGVPQVWEAIRKGVTSKVAAGSFLTRTAFAVAYRMKLTAMRWHIPVLPGLADTVVFSKVKAQTGGRLRFVLNGGAKISDASQEFLTTTLVTVLNGYGLTETVGMSAIMHPSFYSVGPAGCIVPSMEIKLVDIPDAGYFSDAALPQGEICVRGQSLFKGYYKDEKTTKEVMTEDGWFKTGDVGQWNQDGTLSVIDRIKNLVKLSGGEYIALEKLESVYKSNSLVLNLAVFANSDAKQPIAVAVLHEVNFAKFVTSQSLGDPADIHTLVHNKAVKNAILKDLNATGRKAGLAGIELLGGVALTADEWTPDTGLVTAAQKLQRKVIEKKFHQEIEEAYKASA